jgi:AbiV family abortive infection protein
MVCSLITAPYLEQGTALALEQAGFLLSDAAALHKLGSYATALAVVQFGREELGRCRILRGLRDEVVRGMTVSLDDVLNACSDHQTKQRKSQLGSVNFRPTSTEGLGRAIQTTLSSRPDSDDYQQAREAIDAAAKAKLGKLPDLRHAARLTALYVDPTENGTGWNRPRDTTREQSYQAILDFVNDYAGVFNRLRKDEPALLALVPQVPAPEVGLIDPI